MSSAQNASSSVSPPVAPTNGGAAAIDRPLPDHEFYTRLAKKSARTFLYSYLGKCGINVVFALLSGRDRKLLMRLDPRALMGVVGRDSLGFGLFVSAMGASYIALRRLLDQFFRIPLSSLANPTIAGAASALAVFLDTSDHRRHEISLYLFARALHALLRLLEIRGTIPTIPHGSTISFSAMCAVIMYAFMYRPDILKKSYREWIGRLASRARLSVFLWYLREVQGLPHNKDHYYRGKLGLQPDVFFDKASFLK